MVKLLLPTTVAVLAVVAYFFAAGNDDFRLFSSGGKRGLFDSVLGSLSTHNVENDISSYDSKQTGNAAGREQTMVNSYYNLVTDFYEYGWGKSFHFAHTLVNEEHEESIVRHEHRLSDALKLKAGMKVIDCGCGVGGPAREIARYSGATIIGVTLNDYQVQKGRNHTFAENMTTLVSIHQGDYTKLQYDAETFDAAYAVEATCHAQRLEDVYGEVFRVLKPGGMFGSYEWLSTAAYDKANPEHQQVLTEIEYGDGLPPIRSLADALKAARTVGFNVISEVDLAQDRDGTRPWYHRLDLGWLAYRMTHYSCVVSEFLGMAPVGTVNTHTMLIRGADGLVKGGKLNIFTPMHLIVMQKPAK